MVQVKQTMVTILWKPGDGISVDGGWLCGYDFGEFGGGLYRFGPKGIPAEKLSSGQITNLARIHGEIFGVRHVFDDESSKYILVKLEPKGKSFDYREIGEVNSFSVDFVWDGDRLIFATAGTVSTLGIDGTQTIIARFVEREPFHSLVRRSNGEIWIGNNWTLTCLKPKWDGTFDVYWLIQGG